MLIIRKYLLYCRPFSTARRWLLAADIWCYNRRMKAMFGRRLPYFIGLLAFEFVVILIIVVWTFRGNEGFFRSIYDFFAGSSVVFSVFDFIWNNAELISGVVVLAALALLYISFRQFQRGRAVNRVHSWARNSVVALAQYRQKTANDLPAAGYGGARVLIDKLADSSKLALEDARILGGEINTRARKTVAGLREVERKLNDEDASLFDDLQDLQQDFADVMILAFEFVK